MATIGLPPTRHTYLLAALVVATGAAAAIAWWLGGYEDTPAEEVSTP